MAQKFKNRYRIKSHRLSSWDYSRNGYYFITLVVQHRNLILGNIENGEMRLSQFGEIVKLELLNSLEIRDELNIDEFIIMPNHLHAIVVIEHNDNTQTVTVETHGRASLQTQHNDTSQQRPQQQTPSFIRKPRSLSSFIAGFKSRINSKIDDLIDTNQLDIPKYNKKNHFFQPNYYDHIIRNEKEYLRIKEYIINNPCNWGNDSLIKKR